jgi:hypothetical protein
MVFFTVIKREVAAVGCLCCVSVSECIHTVAVYRNRWWLGRARMICVSISFSRYFSLFSWAIISVDEMLFLFVFRLMSASVTDKK